MPHRLLVAVVVACAFPPTFANAQITPISSPSAFSGRETLITFEGQGTYGQLSSLSGVTFSQGSTSYVSLATDDARRPFGPPNQIIVENIPTNGPVTLAFASPMTRVGLEVRYNGCDERATVQFYNGATQIGSAQTAPAPQQYSPGANPCAPAGWVFAAFQAAQPFDRIVVTAPNGFMRLDNVRFEYVASTAVITAIANPSAFSAQATLITFEGQGISGPPTISSLSGITFSAGPDAYVSIGTDQDTRPFGPPDPRVVDNRPSNSQPIALALAAPATKIAFESRYNGCGATVTVELFSGSTAIGRATSPPSGSRPDNNCSPGDFVFAGFQSTVPFDRVRLTAPINGYLRIDNIRYER